MARKGRIAGIVIAAALAGCGGEEEAALPDAPPAEAATVQAQDISSPALQQNDFRAPDQRISAAEQTIAVEAAPWNDLRAPDQR